ncbi:MAG: SGNH/GDSL hydrolase family protein [Acidobacteriota bacterium]
MSGLPPEPERPQRLGEAARTLSIALWGGLLLLLLLEAAVRLAGLGGEGDRLERFAASSHSAPWVQFRVPDQSDERLDVRAGRRRSVPPGRDAGALPPIWMLGGSTTFGWNVRDEDTLPSQLSAWLAEAGGAHPEVVNLGQPYYWSVQEGILLHALLARGERPPSHAIFLDGLNDVLQESSTFRVEPFWTPQVAARVDASGLGGPLCRALRLCRWLHAELQGAAPPTASLATAGRASSYASPEASREELADHLVATYLRHVELTGAMCESAGIRCLFVIQPVPFYRYDRSNDEIADRRDFPLFARVYPRLEEAARGDERLLYLGSALADYRGESPFVDGFHYGRDFHRHLASEIAGALELGELSALDPAADSAQPQDP